MFDQRATSVLLEVTLPHRNREQGHASVVQLGLILNGLVITRRPRQTEGVPYYPRFLGKWKLYVILFISKAANQNKANPQLYVFH